SDAGALETQAHTTGVPRAWAGVSGPRCRRSARRFEAGDAKAPGLRREPPCLAQLRSALAVQADLGGQRVEPHLQGRLVAVAQAAIAAAGLLLAADVVQGVLRRARLTPRQAAVGPALLDPLVDPADARVEI